jgi:type I restriction enzyme, S subunit
MSRKPKIIATKEEERPALVPKLRFPEFRGEWTYEPLSKVLKEHKLKNTEGRDVFSVSMEYGIVNQIELLGRSFAAADTSHYTIGRRYDVVYTKSPLKAFPFGIVKQCKFDGEVALSPLYGVFSPPNPHLGLMIEAYFESPNRSKDFLSPLCQKGAKNTLQITNTTFLSGRLPLPTQPAEQQKIAACLSSVDELIAAQARKVDALKTHKKGLMQQLFPREGETQPRLRFPEFQNAGEWVPKTGSEITSKITKGSSPNWQGFSYQTEGVLFVTSENVRDGFLDVSEPKFLPEEFFAKQSNSHLVYGDILINIVGASIGRNCVYRLKESAFTNQAVALFRVTKEHSFEFISYCYQQDRSQKAVSASQSDSARPNLSLTDLRTMEFFIPSLPEQNRIASCLTSLDDLIAAQTQKHEALKTHKKGLMQQLFPAPEEQAHTSEGQGPGFFPAPTAQDHTSEGQGPGLFPSPESNS